MPGLAAQYPNDVGIESDPAVLFVEKFNESSVADLVPKWGDGRLNTASFSPDVPPQFPAGAQSLQCPRLVGDNGGQLYHKLAGAQEVYVRYYIKYDAQGPPAHSGVWMGGYNPPSDWPQGMAGTKPSGSDFFSAAFERSRLTGRADHYDYWMGMHPDGVGSYWGNTLLNNPAVTIPLTTWTCVEHMVKLNSPLTSLNGESGAWLNDQQVSKLAIGTRGTWNGGQFTQNPAAATTFEGFRWRSTSSLPINWVWMQSYVDGGDPTLVTTTWFTHIVVATKYIGPLTPPTARQYRMKLEGTLTLEPI